MEFPSWIQFFRVVTLRRRDSCNGRYKGS